MTFGTQVDRPTPPPPHRTRFDYLRSKNPGDPKICHAATAPSGKPWLTLVIGSGCATSQDQVTSLLELPRRVEYAIHEAYSRDSIDGDPLAHVARYFTERLIRDRLRPVGEFPAADLPVAPVEPTNEIPGCVADVVLSAALMSKLYFKIKSLGYDAPRRPDHDDEAIIHPGSTSWPILDEEYVAPCRRIVGIVRSEVAAVIDALRSRVDAPQEAVQQLNATVIALVEHVHRRINPPAGTAVEIGLVDIQSLAEFAWFCLTSMQSHVYPGWSDLLLDLSNYDPPDVGRVGAPFFKSLTEAQSVIEGRYKKVTKHSWNRQAGKGSLFDAAASLLNAQDAYRKTFGRGNAHQPPPATAFVTSFDLELELALLKHGEPFVAAMPVHVLSTAKLAHTCWVGFQVPAAADGDDSDSRLERLMNPKDGWFIVGQNPEMDGPVVVRLSGCPLIQLPALGALPELRGRLYQLFERAFETETRYDDEKLEEIGETLQLQHAVVINEHDAMLHNAIDLLAIRPESDPSLSTDSASGSRASSKERYGLPLDFVGGKIRWTRFWMMLGVQIRDSAIRQRIATLVSSVPEHQPPDKPKGTGVAINRHLTALEQDLLFWNGFDVVTDDAAAFGPDLLHYAAHLGQALLPPTPRPPAQLGFARAGICHV